MKLYDLSGDLMEIKKITKLKNGKYKIKLDSYEFITYDDIIINHNLLYRKKIDAELLNILSLETAYYESYNKTLNYCMKKVRSETEVRKYLDKLDIKDIDKESIINKLKSINLIDDRVYVKSYINDKLFLTKDSLNKIKKDLINSNIDVNLIEDEISIVEYDEIEKLEKMIVKRINSNHKYSSYILKNKIITEMMNLGYNYDDIVEVYDKNSVDNYNILIKEYNKLYNKYSKKLKDSELEYTIKNKLYLKGFDYNDIKKEDLR